MTTGAANDFEQATDLAQKMVQRWGMSDVMGPRVYGDNESEVFLGRDMATHRNLSDATAKKVDQEVTLIIERQYDRARQIIESNKEKIEVMAQALLDWETLESDQISQIMSGESPRPPSPPDDGADSGQVGGDGEKDQKPEVGPSVESPAGGSA